VKALFAVNERSGPRRGVEIASLIRRACRFEHEILTCTTASDLDAMVERAERETFDVLFAVGGDGTVHETARRLIGRRIALGVLPTGSGNGFARHIGLPVDPVLALQTCRDGRITTIDTAAVNDLPFVGVMGVGFDAVVARRFASSSVRGLETYVREGFSAFASLAAEDYEITVNEQASHRKAFVIAVANSGQYGNNARIAPLASLQDGLLDVVIVESANLLQAPILLARLFTGSMHRASGVATLQTAMLTIRRQHEGPAHLDGEPVDLPAELQIRIVPRSLRVLVPAAAGKI
jgi:YegS/Rv2252/BmrU family lipid kinase